MGWNLLFSFNIVNCFVSIRIFMIIFFISMIKIHQTVFATSTLEWDWSFSMIWLSELRITRIDVGLISPIYGMRKIKVGIRWFATLLVPFYLPFITLDELEGSLNLVFRACKLLLRFLLVSCYFLMLFRYLVLKLLVFINSGRFVLFPEVRFWNSIWCRKRFDLQLFNFRLFNDFNNLYLWK